MEERTDADLVGLARSGDKDAFGTLAERHQRMAARVATGMVRDENVALELTQEAILRAYLSLDRLRDGHRFQSWLYGIVLNVCRSHIRDQKVDLLSLEVLSGGFRRAVSPSDTTQLDPDEAAEAKEQHEVVLAAVSELPPRLRAATLLYYYEQLGVREVAAVLGISVAAVKGRLHKARGQLRDRLVPPQPEVGASHDAVRDSRNTPSWRSTMAQVVASNVVTCPLCAVQANIRVWSCGCQGLSYPDHLERCELDSSYFESYDRYCQELQARGRNPQRHLVALIADDSGGGENGQG